MSSEQGTDFSSVVKVESKKGAAKNNGPLIRKSGKGEKVGERGSGGAKQKTFIKVG